MEERFTQWLLIGLYYAKQAGFDKTEAEDCAVTFVEHLHEKYREQQEAGTEISHVCAWEQECARHFVGNYRRDYDRHHVEATLDLEASEGIITSTAMLQPTGTPAGVRAAG